MPFVNEMVFGGQRSCAGCWNSTVMYHSSEYIRPVVNEPNSLTPPRSETLSERGAFDRDHQSRTRLREWSSTTVTRWTISFALARARDSIFQSVGVCAREDRRIFSFESSSGRVFCGSPRHPIVAIRKFRRDNPRRALLRQSVRVITRCIMTRVLTPARPT